MEYLFILGRNPELSILELQGFFGNFNYKKQKNAILAEVPEIKKRIINRFGGVIAIGQVIDIKKLNSPNTTSNKLNYVVWNFTDNDKFFDEIREELKIKFKEDSFKATEKKVSNFLKLQSGQEVRTLSSNKLIDEQYFVFNDKFGKIIETCNYEELEKQDMEKPVRRESLAISPRLSKIMINLSKTKPGETIVDPFCGVGVILQEALRDGINVIGIDKDPEAIQGILKNLKWGKFSEENYKIINGDSSTVKIKKSNAIVTEPSLGQVLKYAPNKETAIEMIKEYEKLIIRVLNNMKENITGRFVFTGPFIQTTSKSAVKRIGCDVNKILSNTRLRLVSGFPIAEFRENQAVGREIFVLVH
ncbi:MAG: DNA methyltransferase [Candidatus Pacearchaeota archaeon]|jgi:tRNA G10  N-methylase Trm11